MKRSHVAACALAIAGAAAVAAVPSLRAPSVEMSGERAAPSEVQAGSAIDLAVRREQLTAPDRELFVLPAAAKPRGEPTTVIPALPSPPPVFPYRYAGKADAGGGVELYLVRADGRLQPVRAGTVLDAWRIDRVTPDSIEVTYLPSELKRSILLATMTGEAQPTSAADAGERAPRALPAVAENASDRTPKTPSASAPAGIAGGIAVSARAEARVAGASAANAPKPVAFSAPAVGAPLGEAAPTQGSMPTRHAGGSGSATIQTGPTPSGTLGDATPSGGRLGE